MPRRAKILFLPEQLRSQLDQRLIEGQFSGYQSLSEWLNSLGYEIGRTAVRDYGAAFRKTLAGIRLAAAQAREVIAAAPDSEAAMSGALIALMQRKLFSVLAEVQTAGDMDDLSLSRLARAIADLGRVTLHQKAWEQEARERLAVQKAAAAKRISEEESRSGLSPEAAESIRAVLLGIDPLNAKVPSDGRAADAAR